MNSILFQGLVFDPSVKISHCHAIELILSRLVQTADQEYSEQ